MKAALVVVADVGRQRAAKRGLGGKGDTARELRLERVKERFGARVVARAAHARALLKPVPSDEAAEGRAHILGAAITVENQPPRRTAALQGSAEHSTGFPCRVARIIKSVLILRCDRVINHKCAARPRSPSELLEKINSITIAYRRMTACAKTF